MKKNLSNVLLLYRKRRKRNIRLFKNIVVSAFYFTHSNISIKARNQSCSVHLNDCCGLMRKNESGPSLFGSEEIRIREDNKVESESVDVRVYVKRPQPPEEKESTLALFVNRLSISCPVQLIIKVHP